MCVNDSEAFGFKVWLLSQRPRTIYLLLEKQISLTCFDDCILHIDCLLRVDINIGFGLLK